MKSKTFCFNRTIFKKNFTHFWPLWLLYQIYLLVVIPVWWWQKAASPYYYYGTGNEDTTYRMYQLVELAVHRMIPPLPVFFFAVAAALAVFSYLYSAKSANMMHALPVNRLELYVTNYLSGLIFLIVPEIITFFITVLVCLANQFTCIQYLFAALLAQAGVTFFAYSLAVFVAMFTGQAFAMPCYYVIVNYLYVGCMFIVAKVIETISYGIENAWNPGKSCILSPLYYLNNNLRSSLIYTENGNGITGIKITACRSPESMRRQQLCLSWRLTSCIKDGRLRRRATGSASGSSSRYSAGEQHFAEVWSSVSRSYPCSRICRSCANIRVSCFAVWRWASSFSSGQRCCWKRISRYFAENACWSGRRLP